MPGSGSGSDSVPVGGVKGSSPGNNAAWPPGNKPRDRRADDPCDAAAEDLEERSGGMISRGYEDGGVAMPRTGFVEKWPTGLVGSGAPMPWINSLGESGYAGRTGDCYVFVSFFLRA